MVLGSDKRVPKKGHFSKALNFAVPCPSVPPGRVRLAALHPSGMEPSASGRTSFQIKQRHEN